MDEGILFSVHVTFPLSFTSLGLGFTESMSRFPSGMMAWSVSFFAVGV